MLASTFSFFGMDQRRRRLARRASAGPLHDYLSVPFPDRNGDCRATRYIALDFETTGIDPRRHAIISAGLVEVDGQCIDLSTARHWLVAPETAIPEDSAVIHRITDDRAAQGMSLAMVLEELLGLLAGRVMIAHFARIECGFLAAACKNIYGESFLMPVVDTYQLAKRQLDRHHQVYRPDDLRLDALRAGYNLPRYRAHDALSDAVAAAELFLAQIAERETSRPMPLRDYLCRPL